MNHNPTQASPVDQLDEREPARIVRRSEGWILGILLILLAVIMLLHNLNIYTVHNWWALFILFPALGSFAGAWRMARQTGGQHSEHARSALVVGVLLTLVTGMFLFNLSWTVFGPILLVLAGIAIVANTLLTK